jgi:hypothetical protein
MKQPLTGASEANQARSASGTAKTAR